MAMLKPMWMFMMSWFRSWLGEAESNSYAEFASRIGPAEAKLDGYAEEAYTDAAEDVDVG